MKIEKLEQKLGKATVAEMASLPSPELEQVIITAEKSMKLAKDELEANPKYQELKENLSALSQGLKEVNSRQRAKIQYALHLLEGESRG